ncbi:MAG: winged helix-turn-helix domain-containing protein [Promethearchaeota archaeon]
MSQNDETSSGTISQPQLESLTVTDSELALTILHGKKKMILSLLLNNAMTIQEIKKETGLNPGTIKRHLIDLMSSDLIDMVKEERSEKYNINMKFYRAKAKEIRIDITLS